MAEKLNFKEDQKRALEFSGDLVLTASAGTGKTTILVEKFAHTLIQQASDQKSPSVINSMVAITFTEMAAAELKTRIRERLFEEMSNPETEDEIKSILNKIVRDLDSAYIGTIHSFCKRLIIENFLVAEVNPAFSILDDEDAEELKNDAADRAIHELLADRGNPLFGLISAAGLQQFKEEIRKLASKLRCDGIETISPDDLICSYRQAWPDPAKLINAVKLLIEEINSSLTLFNADKGSKTTLAAQEATNEALQVLGKMAENPEAIFEMELPEILLDTRTTPVPKNKGLELVKELSLEARILIGRDKSYKTNLKSLANLSATLPLVKEVLKLTSAYMLLYDDAKNKIDSFDFDDLLLKTKDMLKEKEEVRKHYQQKFKYIFVDEFQDVNAVQMEIVELLRGLGRKDGNSSLFVVGDAKQSIYKFRSADVLRFEGFIKKVVESGGSNLQLKSNFRSTPELINAFNALFDRMFEIEGENKYQTGYQHLEPGLGEITTGEAQIEFLDITRKDARHEAQMVAHRINEMLHDQHDEEELLPGDIAILLRTTGKLKELETEFKRASIPYRVVKGKGFFLQREVWDIAAYLKAIWFPEDHFAVAAMLRSPLCLLSDETLFHLAEDDILNSPYLFSPATAANISDEDERKRFLIIADLIDKHRISLDTSSTAEIITQLLSATGYDAYLLSTIGGDQAAANIRKLIELSRSFEAKGVETGLEFALDLFSKIFTEKNEAQATVVGDERHNVKIMTIHKSKGLQFPVVFIPFTHSSVMAQKDLMVYDSHLGIGMKEYNRSTGKKDQSSYYKLVGNMLSQQDDAELLRLLYVAATRAKRHLIIPVVSEKTKSSLIPSWKNRLVRIGHGEEEFWPKFGVKQTLESDIRLVTSGSTPLVDRLEEPLQEKSNQAIIDKLLMKAELERDHKTSSINCGVWDLINKVYPREANPEYEEYLRKVQAETSSDEENSAAAPAEIGTMVHEVLEEIDFGKLPSEKELEKLVADKMFPDDSCESITNNLQQWLSTPEVSQLGEATKLRKETPFSLKLDFAGVALTINGIIDLVAEFADGSYWLVDYKYAFSKESPEYQLQMQIYAMALQKAFGKLPDRCLLAYLKNADNVDIAASATDIREAEETISQCLNVNKQDGPGQISLF